MKKIQKVAIVGALILIVAVLVPIGCSVWEHRDSAGESGNTVSATFTRNSWGTASDSTAYTVNGTGLPNSAMAKYVTQGRTYKIGGDDLPAGLSVSVTLSDQWGNGYGTMFTCKCTVTISGTPSVAGYTSTRLGVEVKLPKGWTKGFQEPYVTFDITVNPISYSVSVSSGGNGTVSGSGTYVEGTWVTIKATPDPHYYLSGWSDNGSQETSRSWNLYSNFSSTAYFARTQRYVTINVSPSGGGTVNKSSANYNEGDDLSITATPNTGYEFVSWVVDGVTYGTNPVTFNVSKAVTCTANFKLIEYAINYELHGGTKAVGVNFPSNYTYNPNGSVVIPSGINDVLRDYCSFNQWRIGSTSGTALSNGSLSTNRTGPVTLHATWTGRSYTVTLDTNAPDSTEITGATNGQQITYTYDPNSQNNNGCSLPIPNTGSGSKYAFWGWFVDNNNERYIDTFSKYETATLRAVWYTVGVIVRPNYGTGSISPIGTQKSGICKPGKTNNVWNTTSFTLDWSEPSREEGGHKYGFRWWNTKQDGTGTSYNIGATFVVSMEDAENLAPQITNMRTPYTVSLIKDLYAVWEYIYEFTLRYNENSGTWPEGSTHPTVNIERRASQMPIQYTIDQFNIQSGDNKEPVNSAEVDGETIQIQFEGWDPASDKIGTGTYVKGGGNLTIKVGPYGAQNVDYTFDNESTVKELILYAVWPRKVNVTFKATPPEDTSLEVTIFLPSGVPSTTDVIRQTLVNGKFDELPTAQVNGYYFGGWLYNNGTTTVIVEPYTGPNTGTYFNPETTPQVTPNWVKQHHISFSGNGIVFPSTSYITNMNEKLDKLPELNDTEDYYVEGWYTAADGGTKVLPDDGQGGGTPFYDDAVVYAHWKSIYRIRFDPNGGVCDTPSLRTNKDFEIDRYPVATRVGYDAMGSLTKWWIGELEVRSDKQYDGNTTLVAKWTPRTYDLTFDANGGAFIVDNDQTDSIVWEDVIYGQPLNVLSVEPLMYRNNGLFPIPDVTKPGCTFMGWSRGQYTDGEGNADIFPTDVLDNKLLSGLTIYAVWVKGNNMVTFNAMGGSVAPETTFANKDGIVIYYPIPKRTGYAFIGWYNWPVYSTTGNITSTGSDQESIWDAYKTATGAIENAAVNGTLLLNTYGTMTTQFQYDAGSDLWVDVTDRTFRTFYYRTEEIITLIDGQSGLLNRIWASCAENCGWTERHTAGMVTYTPAEGGTYFRSFEDLLKQTIDASLTSPVDGDVAGVQLIGAQSVYYYDFTIPNGVTLVLVRDDEMDDVAYTWNVVTTDGVTVKGWRNTTQEWGTVILPNHIFDQPKNTLYAHWVGTPPPPSKANTCYIERRLDKYSDDTIRLYLPIITSIEDTTSAMLVQKDTIMFGYEHKFVTDLGTTRRFTVGVERANPFPYNDYSNNPNDWSNGKWYSVFVQFTDYWQNYGRDPITGSMIGGFKFHYEPMESHDTDDRVDYEDLYPIIDKNVFLTGMVDTSFNVGILKFTMNLAVGQMTSDSNSSGYEITLTSDPDGKDYDMEATTLTPDGVDFQLPDRPTWWGVPPDMMFCGWIVSTPTDANVSYNAGDTIDYEVARTITKCVANWIPANGAVVMLGNSLSESDFKKSSSMDEMVLFEVNQDGYVVGTVQRNIMMSITMVGGGGAGAGGMDVPEDIDTGWDLFDDVANFVQDNLATYVAKKYILESGGAGGSGEVKTGTFNLETGDKIYLKVGKGGTRHNDTAVGNDDFGIYTSGNDGEGTELKITYASTSAGMGEITAGGGFGGKSSGDGGESYNPGGNGGTQHKDATDGSTTITGQRGDAGSKGKSSDQVTASQVIVERVLACGGAGGGAAGFNMTVKIGSENLGTYQSKGGNGGSNGSDAENGQYGGGGGSGCCGHRPAIATLGVADIKSLHVWHFQRPANGGDGIIVMYFKRM